jgi:hypothetical protein
MDGWMDGAGVVFLSLCATIFLLFFNDVATAQWPLYI